MERSLKRTLSLYLYPHIVGSFFFNWVGDYYKKLFSIHFSHDPKLRSNNTDCISKRVGNKKIKLNHEPCAEDVQDGMHRQDIETVMDKLRIFPGAVKEEFRTEWLAPTDLAAIFDDEGPSSDEVNHAFSAFDENEDGYIDERELQRVLLSLGCREGSTTAACQRMIAAYDKNKDGKIDFNEFQDLLTSSFN